MSALLTVAGLTVRGPAGPIVHGSDFELPGGSTLAVVGESGSGKSLTARALTGLLPPGLSATGRITLAGKPVDPAAKERDWRGLRGRDVVLLMQDPFTSLSPTHRCDGQIAAALPAAVRRSRTTRAAAVARALDEVGLPQRVARAYPFELSGGMRQRVAIAAALVSEPALLIADEPTTALDVTTQRGILDLLGRLQRERTMGLILITHDLRLARERADEVLVMRHGRIVEAGPIAAVLDHPTDPYTAALQAAVPPLHVRLDRLPTLDDEPVSRQNPVQPKVSAAEAAPLLTVRALSKTFPGGVVALDRVELTVGAGEAVGVVGESGSGKTTLARCVIGLETADSGEISLVGRHLPVGRGKPRVNPEAAQIVFQDPYSALNPSLTVGAALVEALKAGGRPAADVPALLAAVRLPAEFADRLPRSLSGGQRQRVAVARALAPRPRLLICDESVSALDVSVQAQILNLLSDLREELGLALLFITHDLAVVRQVADRISVMRHGVVVETGSTDEVLDHPQHEYTQLLLSSVPGFGITLPPKESA